MGLIAETAVIARRKVTHVVTRVPAVTGGALMVGGAMMLHDWKDRALWFKRGRGSQL